MKSTAVILLFLTLPLLSCGDGLTSITELEGTWSTGCVAHSSAAVNGLKSTVEIRGGVFEGTYTIYLDAGCTIVASGTSNGTSGYMILRGGASTPNGATQLDIFGSNEGGVVGWEADAFIGGVLNDPSEYNERFSIFKRDGDTLYVGLANGSADGRTSSDRHDTFATYTYTRQ